MLLKLLYHNFVNKSRRKPCISSIPQGIAYHQHEVLYIINAKENARRRVMRYKKSDFLALFDDIHRTLCGDDIPMLSHWIKKSENFVLGFFGVA